MRDTSSMPLPPTSDPPKSDYDIVFGQDAGWRDPAGPARAAAAAAREAAAAQAAAQAAAAAGAAPPAAPAKEEPKPFFSYPDNGVLYQPKPAASAPPAATPPPGAEPKQPETPQVLKIKTPSGFEIEADPKEVAKRYVEHEQLREDARRAEALRNWAQANPERAAILERIVRGEDLNRIQATDDDADAGGEGDEKRRQNPQLAQYEARVRQMEAQLALVSQQRAEAQQKQSIEQVMEQIPFAKNAPPALRDALVELARVDYARHQHEGITPADALRRRAALMEQAYREQLAAATKAPAAPSPLAPDRQPITSVTQRRPATSGLGFAEWLTDYRKQLAQ